MKRSDLKAATKAIENRDATELRAIIARLEGDDHPYQGLVRAEVLECAKWGSDGELAAVTDTHLNTIWVIGVLLATPRQDDRAGRILWHMQDGTAWPKELLPALVGKVD